MVFESQGHQIIDLITNICYYQVNKMFKKMKELSTARLLEIATAILSRNAPTSRP